MSSPGGLGPDRLELIWGRTTTRNRGPKPSLDVEQITQAAIELADDAGLEAVSMKRLAEVLKVGTMTLYTYVPDKGTLLQLMLDRAVASTELPETDPDWRLHLRDLGCYLLDLYQNHPWMLQINVEGPPVTPHQMRYLESILASLHKTGLNYGESLGVAMSLNYFVLGAARIIIGVLQAEKEAALSAEELHAGRTEVVRRVIDPAEFPLVFDAMTDPAIQTPILSTPESLGFDFGLERLIDGVAAYIDSRSQ